MCFYQDVTPDFWAESISKAQRDYRCEGCSSGIKAGELYNYGRGKSDGEFYVYRTCGVCELDRHRIHIAELAAGCRDYESWCQPDELDEYLPEHGMNRSSRMDGQRWMNRVKRQGGRGVAPLEAYR